MSSFKLTEEELKEARAGGKPDFKNNEEVTFLITGFVEKANEDSKGVTYCFSTKIIGGDHNDKKHTLFFDTARKNKVQALLSMLDNFYGQEDYAKEEGIEMTELIGKTVMSPCYAGIWEGKAFATFSKFTEVSDVPSMGEAIDKPVEASEIPF